MYGRSDTVAVAVPFFTKKLRYYLLAECISGMCMKKNQRSSMDRNEQNDNEAHA